MTEKPTAGDRIAAFMAAQQHTRRELWLECWFIPQGETFAPRVDCDFSALDNRREPDLWRTWYLLEGQEFKIVFCSQWKVPFELAIWIADAVVKGRTVYHELILE